MTSCRRPVVDPRGADPTQTGQVVSAICVCGHSRAVHRHYRRGYDCGLCGAARCARFRDHRGRLHDLLSRLRRDRS